MNNENQIPCIIDQGVVFNKKDMCRILQSLDRIQYTEVLQDSQASEEIITREGVIVDVFEDDTQATIFFNRRIYLNVNSFDYLKIVYIYNVEPEISPTPLSENSPEQTNPPSPPQNNQPVTAPVKTQSAVKLPPYSIELAMAGRKIVISPQLDPLDNMELLLEESEERRRQGLWINISDDYDD